ncbi:MAG: pitrilysin family protein [Blastocatellia bacterium]
MRFSKLYLPLLCCLLLSSVVLVSAQKKDKTNPTMPEAAQVTPYSSVRRDNLLNGLQLITLDRQSDAIVKCDLVIRGGAMFDLVGKTGLAALTQDSLMIVNPQIKEELASLGARMDWGVTWDTTWFHIETPANNFGPAFEIVARLLVVESMRPEAFKKTQQAQLEELKAHKLTAGEQANEAFFNAMYGAHPYGHNIEGNEKTLAAITMGDAYDIFRKFYIANNASAIVVGNISHERVMQVFKVLFGGWAKGQIVPATFRQPSQTSKLKLVKVDLPQDSLNAANIELRGGLIGVKRGDMAYLTTDVMARVLANRLKPDADATSATLSVKADPRILSGPVFFSASVPSDKAAEFSRRVTEGFAALATAPISEEEVAAARSSLAGEYAARSIESNLREVETFLLPRNFPTEVAGLIEKISAADVQRVAKRLFDANALTVVVVGKVNDAFNSGKPGL